MNGDGGGRVLMVIRLLVYRLLVYQVFKLVSQVSVVYVFVYYLGGEDANNNDKEKEEGLFGLELYIEWVWLISL